MNTKPIILKVPAFEDFRGYLAVPHDKSVDFKICQINQGYSKKAFTLRGLHFQEGEHAQAKLVSCLHGSIFNVAVDLRPGETFGHAYSAVLSFENRKQMYIPHILLFRLLCRICIKTQEKLQLRLYKVLY